MIAFRCSASMKPPSKSRESSDAPSGMGAAAAVDPVHVMHAVVLLVDRRLLVVIAQPSGELGIHQHELGRD
jgi:hypothetical protein